MLLVCKEWQNGFASGLLRLMPRVLKIREVADRLPESLLVIDDSDLALPGRLWEAVGGCELLRQYA